MLMSNCMLLNSSVGWLYSSVLQQCITDVADWCGSRRLQLNAAKTELMWFGSSAALSNLSQSDMIINDGSDVNHVIQPVTTVRDLGVHLD